MSTAAEEASSPEPLSPAEEIARKAWTNGGHKLKTRIDLTQEPKAVIGISDALNLGAIPELYVRSGAVTQVLEVDDGTGEKLIIRDLNADSLRMLLAQHTECYRKGQAKDDKPAPEIPVLPPASVVNAVLSQVRWQLPALAGVTTMPMVRKDGTILTEPGYDPATRLFHRPAFKVNTVRDNPDDGQITWAREYLEWFLADFCFDTPASRANFIAFMLTPAMRLYVGGLPPLAVISAVTRGSGKTLLTEILRSLYGARLMPWPKRDEEMAKVITSTLKDVTDPVIVFDNIGPFDKVEHATLAALLTSDTWTDRILGSTATYTGANDRLWFVTGNNVSLGGDIASRSVLVRLDPDREDPEARDGFRIDDMWSWLKDDTNRSVLLECLLILARAWIADGGHRDDTVRMRNFSAWGQAMGGLLAFHGIPDFLSNKDALAVSDDEESDTAAFLEKWLELHQGTKMRATQLVENARVEYLLGEPQPNRWDGTFPTKADGKPFTGKALGHYLKGRNGRIFGGIKLVGEYDSNRKIWFYSVRPATPQDGSAA